MTPGQMALVQALADTTHSQVGEALDALIAHVTTLQQEKAALEARVADVAACLDVTLDRAQKAERERDALKEKCAAFEARIDAHNERYDCVLADRAKEAERERDTLRAQLNQCCLERGATNIKAKELDTELRTWLGIAHQCQSRAEQAERERDEAVVELELWRDSNWQALESKGVRRG